ncbi:MAG TPA: cold shock domain-containing protein [Rudaea sp.]|nr:cold shock domain-containing protein [Rudaea sp.]
MRTHGTLTKWNDDRGFGFITPAHAGDDIFVHVSAFPRDGVRPQVNELISFDVEVGGDGKRRAVRVLRPGSSARSRGSREASGSRSIPLTAILALLAAGAAGGYAYRTFTLAQPEGPGQVTPAPSETSVAETFACDGRTRCTQMTSCAEAEYFLRHCPGVQMDGDHDGIPCEQQWCN